MQGQVQQPNWNATGVMAMPDRNLTVGYAHHEPRKGYHAFIDLEKAGEAAKRIEGSVSVYAMWELPKGSWTVADEGSPKYRALQKDPRYREVYILPPK